MSMLTSEKPLCVAEETFVLPAYCTIPGLGVLPMNAALIRGDEPILIDSGPLATAPALIEQLSALIDLEDLRWVWVTHADPDHVGALAALVERAPRARFVTTFMGLGKLGLLQLLPPERAYLLNPGQRLSIGDRELLALRPPIYDAPETLAAFDGRTRTLMSADAFGALLEAPADDASTLSPASLREGMRRWASIDAPWLEHTPLSALAAACGALKRLEPQAIISAHLPPAFDMLAQLTENVLATSGCSPFVGPDQRAMAEMLAAS